MVRQKPAEGKSPACGATPAMTFNRRVSRSPILCELSLAWAGRAAQHISLGVVSCVEPVCKADGEHVFVPHD